MSPLRWPHDEPVEHRERLEAYAPEPLPEPSRSQADRLNSECHDRILAALSREGFRSGVPSGPGAQAAAARSIRRAGGGRSHGRVLKALGREAS